MKRFLLFLLTVTFMLNSSCTAQKNKVTQKQKIPQWKIIKKNLLTL